ncbi:MAG TPA: hypothetical protein ENI52_04030 [Thermoplasmata archaeon]|nr:hypothetical protein [Thermoplasmata archaeon]
MNKKLGELYVDVSARGVSNVNRSLSQTEKQAKIAANAANLLKNALLGIGSYTVINTLKNVVTNIVAITIQREKAIAKLNQQLINHNELTEKNMRLLLEQANALQRVTTFSNDEIIAAQAMLASFNLTTEQLRKMTPRLLDVAVMTENTTGQMTDLVTVAKMVGVALSGQAGRLAQAGIKMSEYEKELWNVADGQEKFNLLLQIFDNNAKGLSTSVGSTLHGQLRQLNNDIEDIKKGIGEDLLPTIKDLVIVLKDAAPVLKVFGLLPKLWAWTSEQRKKFENYISGVDNTAKSMNNLTEETYTLKDMLHKYEEQLLQANLAIKAMKEYTEEDTKAVEKQVQTLRDLQTMLREINADYNYAATTLERVEIANERASNQMRKAERHLFHNTELIEESTKATDHYAEATQIFSLIFKGFNISLLQNKRAFHDWATGVVQSIGQVIIKLLAMGGIVKMLEAMGVPAGALLSLGQKIGIFQTPSGDMFAYREGLDFGKLFFGGMQEQLTSMISNISNLQRQEPVKVIIHSGDPATFVEFVSRMPTPYKSKFYRETVLKAKKFE